MLNKIKLLSYRGKLLPTKVIGVDNLALVLGLDDVISVHKGTPTGNKVIATIGVQLATFKANLASASLKVGGTTTVTTSNLLPARAKLGALKYTSSSTAIARVDTTGKVTAATVGSVTITVEDTVTGITATTPKLTVAAAPPKV